jgi:hypothetical protein
MKKIRLIVFFWCVSCVMIFGQQNFFNVPSADITEQSKVFFQQQFNMFSDGLQSNTTLNYGLGKGFELGFNYLGLSLIDDNGKWEIPLNPNVQPYNPFLTINAQKRVDISPKFALAAGMQFGLTTTKHSKQGGYGFLNAIYRHEEMGLKMVFGAYRASNSFFGEGARLGNNGRIGFQYGIEQNLWHEKVLFQADFISGKHNIGEIVIGGAVRMSQHWILSAGYQIPTFKSASVKALVLEFTFVPN